MRSRRPSRCSWLAVLAVQDQVGVGIGRHAAVAGHGDLRMLQFGEVACLVGVAQHDAGALVAAVQHQHRGLLLGGQRMVGAVPLPGMRLLAIGQRLEQPPHAQHLTLVQRCSGGRRRQ
jgi:hypothetical protein